MRRFRSPFADDRVSSAVVAVTLLYYIINVVVRVMDINDEHREKSEINTIRTKLTKCTSTVYLRNNVHTVE